MAREHDDPYLWISNFFPDLAAWDGLSAQYWGVIGVPTGLLFGVLGSWARLGADKLAGLVTEIRS